MTNWLRQKKEKATGPLPISDSRIPHAPYRIICGDCFKTTHKTMQASVALATAHCPDCDSTCVLVEPDVKERDDE